MHFLSTCLWLFFTRLVNVYAVRIILALMMK